MMTPTRALGWVLLLATAATAAAAPAYPQTPRRPVQDSYHGSVVVDDYRWLEDLASPETRAWAAAQDAVARRALSALPQRAAVQRELQAMLGSSARRYGFEVAAGRLFALEFQPPRDQDALVVMAANGDPRGQRVVLDPTRIDPSGRTTIDWFKPSPDGKLVAVSLSRQGSEVGTLHVVETATGRVRDDRVPRVQAPTGGGSAAWAANGRGVYYTRYPQGDERPPADADFYQQVWFHRLGSAAADDTYVVGRDFPRIAEIQLLASEDGRHLLAEVANGDGGEHAIWLRSGQPGQDGSWRRIADFSDGVRAPQFGRDGRLYALALKGSPRGRIVAMALADGGADLASAPTVVVESDAVIESFLATKSRLYVESLVGGPSLLRVHGLDGRLRSDLAVEPVANVRLGARLAGDAILFGSESNVRAFAWYRVDAAARGARPVKTRLSDPPAYAIDGGLPGVEAVREFAVSKDGTRVPMTIVRRIGAPADGNQPVLLTGYGGYGVSLRPRFSRFVATWLRHGGIHVVANLRGGGEYGEDWHSGGNLLRKQNVFDDFIACAEWLVANRVTRPERLAIEGGSNGGLLVGAALTQRPELFRAAVAHVGIFDMLRVETTPNGVFNVTEFGTSADPAQFRALLDYSPLHRVRDGTAYPAVLLTTGMQDGRVAPWMSFKMAARLQAATTGERPVLLRVALDAGHGVGTSLASTTDEQADTMAFLLDALGMP